MSTNSFEAQIAQIKANIEHIQRQQKEFLLKKQENSAIIEQKHTENMQLDASLQQSLGALAAFEEAIRVLTPVTESETPDNSVSHATDQPLPAHEAPLALHTNGVKH